MPAEARAAINRGIRLFPLLSKYSPSSILGGKGVCSKNLTRNHVRLWQQFKKLFSHFSIGPLLSRDIAWVGYWRLRWRAICAGTTDYLQYIYLSLDAETPNEGKNGIPQTCLTRN